MATSRPANVRSGRVRGHAPCCSTSAWPGRRARRRAGLRDARLRGARGADRARARRREICSRSGATLYRGLERARRRSAWVAGRAAHADGARARRCRRCAPGLARAGTASSSGCSRLNPASAPRSARELMRAIGRDRGGRDPDRDRSRRALARGRSAGGAVRRASGERAALRAPFDRSPRGGRLPCRAGRAARLGAADAGRRRAREVAVAAAAGAMPPVEVWRGELESLARLAGRRRRRARPAGRDAQGLEARLARLTRRSRRGPRRSLCVA